MEYLETKGELIDKIILNKLLEKELYYTFLYFSEKYKNSIKMDMDIIRKTFNNYDNTNVNNDNIKILIKEKTKKLRKEKNKEERKKIFNSLKSTIITEYNRKNFEQFQEYVKYKLNVQ